MYRALIVLLATVILSCSPGLSPEEACREARHLLESESFQKAYNIYREVLDGGDGVSDDLRFKAAVESGRCLIALRRFKDARDEFMKLDRSFPEKMSDPRSYRYGLTVINDLVREKGDVEVIIDVLDHLENRYPDIRDKLKIYADEILIRPIRIEVDPEKFPDDLKLRHHNNDFIDILDR